MPATCQQDFESSSCHQVTYIEFKEPISRQYPKPQQRTLDENYEYIRKPVSESKASTGVDSNKSQNQESSMQVKVFPVRTTPW